MRQFIVGQLRRLPFVLYRPLQDQVYGPPNLAPLAGQARRSKFKHVDHLAEAVLVVRSTGACRYEQRLERLDEGLSKRVFERPEDTQPVRSWNLAAEHDNILQGAA